MDLQTNTKHHFASIVLMNCDPRQKWQTFQVDSEHIKLSIWWIKWTNIELQKCISIHFCVWKCMLSSSCNSQLFLFQIWQRLKITKSSTRLRHVDSPLRGFRCWFLWRKKKLLLQQRNFYIIEHFATKLHLLSSARFFRPISCRFQEEETNAIFPWYASAPSFHKPLFTINHSWQKYNH